MFRTEEWVDPELRDRLMAKSGLRDSIFDALIGDGWKEYPAPFPPIDGEKRHFQKRSTSSHSCQDSDKPPFIDATWYKFPAGDGSTHESWQISLTAEHAQGHWVDFKVYSLSPEDFLQVKDAEVARLVRCWDVANEVPQC